MNPRTTHTPSAPATTDRTPLIAPRPSTWSNSPVSEPAQSELVPDASIDNAAWMQEAVRVCKAAAAGDMEARVLHIHGTPPVEDLLHSINHLLDMTDAFMREATASLTYAGKGKFFRRVLPNGMLGSFGRAASCINDATKGMDIKTRELASAEQKRLALEADFQATRKVVEQLAHATHQIANMSGTIDRIADQTNLLALNATIEAARVGAAGRGFAVVAGEVKRLAEQTATATEQIEQHLTAMRDATAQTVKAIDSIWETIRQSSGQTKAK
jgi:hypothetical protein